MGADITLSAGVMSETAKRPMCARVGCPNRLKGKQTKYCSNSCRATASKQKRDEEKRRMAESMVLEEIREKIEPVTRELLTDTVLHELNNLVNLIPAAVQELAWELGKNEEGDFNVEDVDQRHKAAAQVMKMTITNQSIAPASAEAQPAPMQVIIGAGMRSDPVTVKADVQGEEPVELRECLECHLMKPVDEFVGESPRCQTCHNRLLDSVAERYGSDLVRSVHASEE